MPYIQHTEDDQKAMLETIGVSSLEGLFESIPKEIRLRRPLGLPPGRSEYEVLRDVESLGDRNRPASRMVSFMGGGIYDCIVPSVVGAILSRSEFYTAYTPYQAEISQGTLQTIYEFQTLVSNLTGMDLANASMYDGATALAESALLLTDRTRHRVLVANALHPRYRAVLDTYASDVELEIDAAPTGPDGRLDTERVREAIDEKTAVVVVQQPSFLGLVEDVVLLRAVLDKIPAEKRPELLVSVDPVSLGVLLPPGAYGAAVATGEGQALGLPGFFGGPLLGFVAANRKHVRRVPGRLVGATHDADGKRGYVLTLQTREQHIRREKATSNICTNQALLALGITVYLSALGESGFQELARMCLVKAHRLADQVGRLSGYSIRFEAPFFREFVVRCPCPARQIVAAAKNEGFLAGIDLESQFPGALRGLDERDLLVAVTEKRTEEEIDAFATFLGRAGGRG